MILSLLFLLLSVRTFLSHQCSQTTFHDVYVSIYTQNSVNYQNLSGCISSRTLKYQTFTRIEVSNQVISSLNKDAVSNIPNRFNLVFNNNSISKIKKKRFLICPSNAFDSLPSLLFIHLEQNHLEMLLQNTFANLPNLTHISLDNNKLEVFKQDWFYNTPVLKCFYKRHAITSIPKASFITLPSLYAIYLKRNKILFINNNAFLGLENLIKLHLGKNRLVSIEFDFKTVPNLSFLGIQRNLLNYVSDDCLNGMQHSLTLIWIHLNPWQCACLEKLLQWGMNHNITISWQCKNTDLSCIVTENADLCVETVNKTFIAEKQKHFTVLECVQKHKVEFEDRSGVVFGFV
ncbi:hypothetical protein RN001_005975 [Aquatica leii]|uniref:Uncharacterized protein n=1 Tax=Aquatica leii TaxID=1421715 RepID=A0AAN7PHT2_9COLE|nr:hypothetical protein RN001_005975 [Aquatica leii]